MAREVKLTGIRAKMNYLLVPNLPRIRALAEPLMHVVVRDLRQYSVTLHFHSLLQLHLSLGALAFVDLV